MGPEGICEEERAAVEGEQHADRVEGNMGIRGRRSSMSKVGGVQVYLGECCVRG